MGKEQHLLCLNIDQLKETSKKKNSPGLRARHKLEVLERDGFKCVHCASLDNLTIAHIIPPKRKKSRNSSSYRVNNCITLCEKCHVSYDSKPEEK